MAVEAEGADAVDVVRLGNRGLGLDRVHEAQHRVGQRGTDQPSRNIITLTMALVLLPGLSMSRAASRAFSRSPLVISPSESV